MLDHLNFKTLSAKTVILFFTISEKHNTDTVSIIGNGITPDAGTGGESGGASVNLFLFRQK